MIIVTIIVIAIVILVIIVLITFLQPRRRALARPRKANDGHHERTPVRSQGELHDTAYSAFAGSRDGYIYIYIYI